ncbi:MAG: rod shape-determining protein RodA [Candidatus Omnitrophica bacterium]|nr:rod shape-determining protein RodA [Candidatus Omnitrophota bacterium]
MYNISYKRGFDPFLIILPLLIFGIGLLFLYSASRGMGEIKGINFMFRQVAWLAVSIVMLVVIINIDFRRILDWSYLFYVLIALALILILFIGGSRMGARRWLSFGWLTFQPSEFAKLAMILTLSYFLGNNRHSIRDIRTFLAALGITGLFCLLIFKEPDLGSAIALLPILFAILLCSETPMRFIIGTILAGLIASPLFWNFLKDYQKRRLLVFMNPNMDPLGAGYTVIQSKIAIGSGGLFGKGWTSGTQNQLNFLPERHTDFIFSVVGEEWGFAGSFLVILLFCLLIIRILSVASRSNDIYGRLIVSGVAAMISFQVIVNIAMAAGFMPVVGLPLPLISYGGSSLITTWLSLALVINVDMHRSVF